ncbi:hypothetical protein FSP39_023514 [Pinctada imbricata]|uniref:IgGFc-binding protein N-terminal domain-containing protein n=1 Tax=Pinctada imbricata TaxID=66713 RepID=A0AA89CBL1_PINIB|nr:hypothetical protein FSP39_023514 [Pinctada imbricata]
MSDLGRPAATLIANEVVIKIVRAEPSNLSGYQEERKYFTCGVQKYLTVSGETRYDVDCVSDEICHFANNGTAGLTTIPPSGVIVGKRHIHKEDKRQSSSSINLECSECCKGDLCNSQGCGIAGYPSDRGTICYGCSQESDPSRCETLTFCRKDQECSIVGNVHSGFGKRQAGAFNERMCGSCCSTDLCNHHCGGHQTSPPSSTYPAVTNIAYVTTTTPMPTTHMPTRYHDAKWTSFIVLFKEQYSSSSGTVQIMIASETPTVLKVQLPTYQYSGRIETHSISSGFYALNYSTSLRGKGSQKDYKAIMINSTSPISVYGLNHWTGSTEGYMALPVEGLGTEYKIPSLEPTQDDANFMIAATEANTRISITFRSSSSVRYATSYYSSSKNLTITLDKLQTFHLSHSHDLTGTRIYSNKPIAVISGTVCSHVWRTYDNCVDLTEYIPPINYWGTEVLVPDFKMNKNFTIKILSAESNTHIDMYSQNRSIDSFTMPNDVHERNFTHRLPLYIKSNGPILVTIYSHEMSNKQMASMFTVPAMAYYRNEYNIAVPKISDFDNYLLIMVKSKDMTGLRIGGSYNYIAKGTKSEVVCGNTGTFCTVIYVTPSQSDYYYFINHVDSSVRFGVIVYGVSQYNSHHYVYSYPGGMYLPQI